MCAFPTQAFYEINMPSFYSLSPSLANANHGGTPEGDRTFKCKEPKLLGKKNVDQELLFGLLM